MSTELPRVTYSNNGVDFSPVHDLLDREIPKFVAEGLGRRHGNVIGDNTNDVSGTAYTIVSPIEQGLALGEFVSASPEAVERAITAAIKAYPQWAATPWQDRVTTLRAWREALAERKVALAIASLIEIGKSRLEAMGEAEESLDIVDYYIGEMERHNGYEQALRQVLPGEETKSILRPMGAFAVIAPFNFPIALAVNMITGALITGNTVVFKPAPGCGLTGRIIAEALLAAGIPAGVFNFVAGDDSVGRALVTDKRMAGVAFTGSNAVGMSIYRDLATGRFSKPVVAEMGGKNPAYVTASADLQVAAEGVARSAYGLQGQKCSACSVAYVDASVRDEFVERLKAFTATLQIGDPRERGIFMGPAYGTGAAERFDRAVKDAKEAGQILFGGEGLGENNAGPGAYLLPTAVELPGEHRLTREELFLPFLAIRTFTNLEDAIAEGNDVEYGLAAGIYTRRQADLDLFLNTAQAGVLYSNRPSGATTGAWPGVQSFCGWKGSGVSNKGGLGPHYLPQFMREQSHTILHRPDMVI